MPLPQMRLHTQGNIRTPVQRVRRTDMTYPLQRKENKQMGLDAIEILMEVEKDFGVRIPDGESETLHTMGRLRDSIVAHLLSDNDRLQSRLSALVFHHLQTIVAGQMGLKKSRIKPESNFVEDLGVT
jgi:acyl carrier protein